MVRLLVTKYQLARALFVRGGLRHGLSIIFVGESLQYFDGIYGPRTYFPGR